MKESAHVTFDEDILLSLRKEECIDNDSITLEKEIKNMSLQEKPTLEVEEIANKDHIDLPKEWRYVASRLKDLIIGDPSQGVRTRSSYREELDYLAFVSQVESHSLEEAEIDPNWMMAMHDELNEFKQNNIWTLINRSLEYPIIETNGSIETNWMKKDK